MTDEVTVETPVEVPAEPVAVEPAAKADFADHPVYAAFLAQIEAAGGAASHRLHQLLAEARELFNM